MSCAAVLRSHVTLYLNSLRIEPLCLNFLPCGTVQAESLITFRAEFLLNTRSPIRIYLERRIARLVLQRNIMAAKVGMKASCPNDRKTVAEYEYPNPNMACSQVTDSSSCKAG